MCDGNDDGSGSANQLNINTRGGSDEIARLCGEGASAGVFPAQ